MLLTVGIRENDAAGGKRIIDVGGDAAIPDDIAVSVILLHHDDDMGVGWIGNSLRTGQQKGQKGNRSRELPQECHRRYIRKIYYALHSVFLPFDEKMTSSIAPESPEASHLISEPVALTEKETSSPLRIAVIADTHDRFPESVARDIASADEIWHLGDVCRISTLEKVEKLGPPLLVVRGNNDFFQTWPMEVTLERQGRSFRLIHIPPAPAKLGISDVLLHGHTHIPRDEVIGGVRVLNPGAVGKANKGSPPSYGWLTLTPENRVLWEIVLI